jgi:hypothetical protein
MYNGIKKVIWQYDLRKRLYMYSHVANYVMKQLRHDINHMWEHSCKSTTSCTEQAAYIRLRAINKGLVGDKDKEDVRYAWNGGCDELRVPTGISGIQPEQFKHELNILSDIHGFGEADDITECIRREKWNEDKGIDVGIPQHLIERHRIKIAELESLKQEAEQKGRILKTYGRSLTFVDCY